MKLEATTEPASCLECHQPIVDLYYLIVGNYLTLHVQCLKCAQCLHLLDETKQKCFFRAGKFYCAEHFYEQQQQEHQVGKPQTPEALMTQQTRTCQKCLLHIEPNEYVIRLSGDCPRRVRLYHLECFRCARCQCRIEPGCMYGCSSSSTSGDEVLLCSQHYNHIYSGENTNNNLNTSNQFDLNNNSKQNNRLQLLSSQSSSNSPIFTESTKISENQHNNHHHHPNNLPELIINNITNKNSTGIIKSSKSGAIRTSGTSSSSSSSSLSSSQILNRFQNENISSSSSSSSNVVVVAGSSVSSCSSSCSSSSSSSSSSSTSSHRKKKRVRTSFKHQQLRIMKAQFLENPNPDSKELKDLSERTGLQKRVLQVWFQNSRAKQRKYSGPTCTTQTDLLLSGGHHHHHHQNQQQFQQAQPSSIGDEEELDETVEGVDDDGDDDDNSASENENDSTSATSEFLLDVF